jgi:hypothetical protein
MSGLTMQFPGDIGGGKGLMGGFDLGQVECVYEK